MEVGGVDGGGGDRGFDGGCDGHCGVDRGGGDRSCEHAEAAMEVSGVDGGGGDRG